NADYFNWSLSPDSTRIAIIKTGGNHVYVLPLDGSPVHDLTVGGRSGFNTFSWSVDGKGFFIGSTKANLLFIDLNGEAHPLWKQKSGFFAWGEPSPDGRYLAILEEEFSGNIWMIENF